MARRGLSAHEREKRARVAALQTIARGEKPLYRVRLTAAETWEVEWCPWLSIDATSRSDALAAARRALVAWLECAPDAVEVEVA